MTNKSELGIQSPDPAAVFATATSLWQACHKLAVADQLVDLSESYSGKDGLMREVMRIGSQFEAWACSHIAFEELDDVWPYLLEDRFGAACLSVIVPTALAQFDESDCLCVAMRLGLPVRLSEGLRIPIDLHAPNPVTESSFFQFRIQTVRCMIEDDDTVPFTASDDPFDEEFGPPFFSLSGADRDGRLEHIADRRTYSEALSLAQKLAPGVAFPAAPTFRSADRAHNPPSCA
jgi:hypothetical protein